MDRDALNKRIQEYFSEIPTAQLQERYPALMRNRARYGAEEVRTKLRLVSSFDPTKVLPYVIFPLDQRWVYYETEGKSLNEARPDLLRSLPNNEFLVSVPEPRKESAVSEADWYTAGPHTAHSQSLLARGSRSIDAFALGSCCRYVIVVAAGHEVA
jgi:hypothetical protein